MSLRTVQGRRPRGGRGLALFLSHAGDFDRRASCTAVLFRWRTGPALSYHEL